MGLTSSQVLCVATLLVIIPLLHLITPHDLYGSGASNVQCSCACVRPRASAWMGVGACVRACIHACVYAFRACFSSMIVISDRLY